MSIENISLRDLKVKHPELFDYVKSEVAKKRVIAKGLSTESVNVAIFSGDGGSVEKAVNYLNKLYERGEVQMPSTNLTESTKGIETNDKAVADLEDLFKTSPLNLNSD